MSERFVVQVSAGAGPDEVRAFVALLASRVELLLRARGIVVVGRVAAGSPPRSVTLSCAGARSASDDLVGTHVLVHAARGRRTRKRWFAGVSVHEPAGAGGELDGRDVRITAARAGGPGGQRVNKVASAVRAVHAPTGIAVRAAGERSQRANRRAALERIADELRERAEAADARALTAQHAAHHRVARGAGRWCYRLVDGELHLSE
jgi:peptide chain release factor 2/peptide chain release factor